MEALRRCWAGVRVSILVSREGSSVGSSSGTVSLVDLEELLQAVVMTMRRIRNKNEKVFGVFFGHFINGSFSSAGFKVYRIFSDAQWAQVWSDPVVAFFRV